MHSQLDTLPRQHLTDMRRTAERDRLARKAMLGSPQQASKQSDLLIATLVTRSLSIVRRILNVGKHPKRTQIARESVQRDRRRAPPVCTHSVESDRVMGSMPAGQGT